MNSPRTKQDKEAEVPPELYSREYYLTDCEGFDEYNQGLDNFIHDKFKRALELISVNPGDHILDIGCGRGKLIYYCVKKGASGLGLDYSKDAINLAHETFQRLPPDLQAKAHAEVANVETYDFKNKFNVIFMMEVSEHMYDWQLEAAMKKFHEILDDDGTLIISTPNYYYEKYLCSIKRIINILGNIFKWPLRVLRGKYKPKSFKELLNKIFKVKVYRNDLCYQMHVNITTPGRIRSFLKDFDAQILCEDPSVNPISLLTQKWWGRQLIAIAKKKKR